MPCKPHAMLLTEVRCAFCLFLYKRRNRRLLTVRRLVLARHNYTRRWVATFALSPVIRPRGSYCLAKRRVLRDRPAALAQGFSHTQADPCALPPGAAVPLPCRF